MGNKAIRAVRECGIAELRRLLDEVLLFFYLIFSLVNLEPKILCFTWGLFMMIKPGTSAVKVTVDGSGSR